MHTDNIARNIARKSYSAKRKKTVYLQGIEAASYGGYGGYGGYGPQDVGLADWSFQHWVDPSEDNASWRDNPYRFCCTATVWYGMLLAAYVMDAKELWGHDALFDYVDRHMQIENRGEWTRSWSPFAERMWDRYRADF